MTETLTQSDPIVILAFVFIVSLRMIVQLAQHRRESRSTEPLDLHELVKEVRDLREALRRLEKHRR